MNEERISKRAEEHSRFTDEKWGEIMKDTSENISVKQERDVYFERMKQFKLEANMLRAEKNQLMEAMNYALNGIKDENYTYAEKVLDETLKEMGLRYTQEPEKEVRDWK